MYSNIIHTSGDIYETHYLIDASMTAGLAPPRCAALLFAGVFGQVSRRIQRQPPPQLGATDTLILLRVIPVRLVGLPPLVVLVVISLQIPRVILRRGWRGAEINASHALHPTPAPVPLLGATAASPPVPPVVRFHVVNGIGERQRCRAEYMRVCIVAAEIHGAGALTVSSEALVTGRGNIAQLGD